MNEEVCPLGGEGSLQGPRGALDITTLLDRAGEQANRILSHVVDIVQPVLASSGDEDVRFVVDLPDKVKEALKDGRLKLDHDKEGRLYAQLRENGKYSKKFPIKEEVVGGIDPAQVNAAAQMAVVKAQLEDISCTLSDIGEEVSLISEGQRTDREALCASGEAMMLQAAQTTSPEFKRLLVAQAVKSLSDGKTQIERDFETHVRALEAGFDGKGKKTRVQKIDECIETLHRDFAGIHQAASLMAAAYFQVGETGAMLEAVRSYGRFIERVVVPNQALLVSYDKGDTKLVGGVWESRAKALTDGAFGGRIRLSADSVMGLLEEGSEDGFDA
ncbi:hypothetical protein [Caniella muris]|uniref:hypothetical protein n=1 Tax=Caniella muris TaxID=2941502 RepID=UPI0020413967|nr:hypothetical protein [Caniella muris]